MTPLTASEVAAREIFLRALQECSIERALAKKLRVQGACASEELNPQASQINLLDVERLIVIAMGKAAATLLRAVLKRSDIVDGRDVSGVLVAPQPLDPMPSGFAYFPGGHPLPDGSSFEAARAIVQLLGDEQPSSETLCLFLISGGASAMVEHPLDASISLEDTITFNRALVHSGASIAEINCVRKHFSAVKGGRLAQRASHLRQFTMLVSDVPPEHIDALASGPTLPDSSTIAECRQILHRYDLLRQFAAPVRSFFSSESLRETPKPGDIAAPHLVLLSSEDLAAQARAAAESLGYAAFVDNGCDDWNYRDAADYLLERGRQLRAQHRRGCLISAGEICVQVPTPPAGFSSKLPRGGRNQHFVLYAATQMSEADRGTTVLSCGSDGIDGNSPAAGAVLGFDSAESPSREEWMHSAEHALNTFSSFNFLQAQGHTIETGPTGNNLRDMRLLLFE